VRYESGMHVVYSQNFIARKSAGRRGARFIGYKGTLEFDFNKSTIDVHLHNEARHDHEVVGGGTNHHGGDELLMANFADVIRGKDVSHATLAEGILSAEMCLAAQKSSEENCFAEIRPV